MIWNDVRRPTPEQWSALAVCLLSVLVYWPSFVLLHEKWMQATQSYSHGYLIAGLVVVLVYRAAGRLRFSRKGGLFGIAAIVLLNLAWLLAYLADVMVVQGLLVPALAWSALVALFGYRSAITWLFPVGYFVFAVPAWDYLNGILQLMTIEATTAMLDVSGITVFIDGAFVYLENGAFEIAEGCAGQHFFVVGLALSSLFAHLYLRSPSSRAKLVLTAAVACIVMNWVRVATIIFAGYVSDMQHYLVRVDHYTYGWVLFTVMLVPVYLYAHRLEKGDAAVMDEADTVGPGLEKQSALLGRATVILLAASIGPLAGAAIEYRSGPAAMETAGWPDRLGPWQRVEAGDFQSGVDFPGALTELGAGYRWNGETVYVYANAYGNQRHGGELVSSENSLYARELWNQVERSALSVGPIAGSWQASRTIIASDDGRRRVIFSWYLVAGQSYVAPARVKLAEAIASITGNTGSGLRAVAADCGIDCSTAETRLKKFMESNGKFMVALLEGKEAGNE